MNNEISQYFSKSDGSTIATDNDLKSLSTGTVVKNINGKESYKKIAVNVFDKQNDFITDADIGRNYALKSEAVKSINGDGSSTTITYQMADGTNKSFITKDTTYSAGTGLSLSGTTFNVNIPNYKVSDGTNPDATYIMTLDANQNACHPSGYTVERLVEMINNSGTTYSAGKGLTLSGTTFSISQDLLDKINNRESWSTFYFTDSSIEVGDVVSGSNLYIDSNIASPVGSGSWRLMWMDVNASYVSGYTDVRYYGKFQKVG